MTAPAIRAALDAAAEAAREEMSASGSCLSEVCDIGPCDCTRDAATAAVAAFLRAMPACDVLMDRSSDLGMHSTVTLAAAVEAAAGEDGE